MCQFRYQLCKVKLPRTFCHLIVCIFHIEVKVAGDNYVYNVCATCSVNNFLSINWSIQGYCLEACKSPRQECVWILWFIPAKLLRLPEPPNPLAVLHERMSLTYTITPPPGRSFLSVLNGGVKLSIWISWSFTVGFSQRSENIRMSYYMASSRIKSIFGRMLWILRWRMRR